MEVQSSSSECDSIPDGKRNIFLYNPGKNRFPTTWCCFHNLLLIALPITAMTSPADLSFGFDASVFEDNDQDADAPFDFGFPVFPQETTECADDCCAPPPPPPPVPYSPSTAKPFPVTPESKKRKAEAVPAEAPAPSKKKPCEVVDDDDEKPIRASGSKPLPKAAPKPASKPKADSDDSKKRKLDAEEEPVKKPKPNPKPADDAKPKPKPKPTDDAKPKPKPLADDAKPKPMPADDAKPKPKPKPPTDDAKPKPNPKPKSSEPMRRLKDPSNSPPPLKFVRKVAVLTVSPPNEAADDEDDAIEASDAPLSRPAAPRKHRASRAIGSSGAPRVSKARPHKRLSKSVLLARLNKLEERAGRYTRQLATAAAHLECYVRERALRIEEGCFASDVEDGGEACDPVDAGEPEGAPVTAEGADPIEEFSSEESAESSDSDSDSGPTPAAAAPARGGHPVCGGFRGGRSAGSARKH